MARPTTITDEQILEAARLIFVRDGLNATTKEIAREAGIAEGSIFRRFPTKETLFAAAVLTPPLPPWVRGLDRRVGVGDPRANLLNIAREMIRFAHEMLPLVRLAWASGAGGAAYSSTELVGIRDRRLLADYVRREMELGRLRSGDPEALARLLFGACLSYVLDRLTLGEPVLPEETDAFTARVVDALWDGIRPASN